MVLGGFRSFHVLVTTIVGTVVVIPKYCNILHKIICIRRKIILIVEKS